MATMSNGLEKIKLRQELERCLKHHQIAIWQRQQYGMSRANLAPGHLLVLMDFTALSLQVPHEDTVYVQDYILVFEFIKDNTRQMHFLDFLCDAPDQNNKNDYFYVFRVWLDLFRRSSEFFDIKDFNSIEIWSDGGPKHFKTRFCQWMWSFLSYKFFDGKRITHNFFASYHGHSTADAHAATCKRLLRAAYNTSELERKVPSAQALKWGPTNASEFSQLLRKFATRTHSYTIPFIPRDEQLKPPIREIKGIKSQHSFVYQGEDCRSFEKTNCGEGQAFRIEPTE
jgi:hypothetical protein